MRKIVMVCAFVGQLMVTGNCVTTTSSGWYCYQLVEDGKSRLTQGENTRTRGEREYTPSDATSTNQRRTVRRERGAERDCDE